MRIKVISAIISILSIFSLLAGCDSEPVTTQTVIQWERNGTQHWSLDENGNQINVDSHTVDEYSVCSICGSEVFLFDDGSAEVCDYNQYGDWTRVSYYESDGTLLGENTCIYEYDENGVMLLARQSIDGVVSNETTYTVNADGLHIPVRQVTFDIDGSRTENDYDEYGKLAKSVIFDASGMEIRQQSCEYAEAESGVRYLSMDTITWPFEKEVVSEYNEFGDKVKVTEYDQYSNIVLEAEMVYTYDADGNKLQVETYSSGVLESVMEYSLDADGQSYLSKETVYLEDGSSIICTYNAAGELVDEVISCS